MSELVPSLRVANLVELRKARLLPVDGDVLVDVGELVQPEDVIARATIAGETVRLNVAETLGLSPSEEVGRYLLKLPGDSIKAGETVARKKGRIGSGDKVCVSPISGKMVLGPTLTGDLLIAPDPHDVELPAFIVGNVVQVVPRRGAIIEAIGSYVQCIHCSGVDTYGLLEAPLNDPAAVLDDTAIDGECTGKILVAGTVTVAALHAAFVVGVRAVVVGSIPSDVFHWLRTHQCAVTLMVTEGFGSMPMASRTFDLLLANVGRRAWVFAPAGDNAYPSPGEVFVPTTRFGANVVMASPTLAPGAVVRILRGEWAGCLARVIDLPDRSAVLPSGVCSKVVKLVADNGQEIVVGRDNVELVA